MAVITKLLISVGSQTIFGLVLRSIASLISAPTVRALAKFFEITLSVKNRRGISENDQPAVMLVLNRHARIAINSGILLRLGTSRGLRLIVFPSLQS